VFAWRHPFGGYVLEYEMGRLLEIVIRSYLKKRILVQGQGGREVQPGGILQYFEDLNRASNAEIGPKDFFEMASKMLSSLYKQNCRKQQGAPVMVL
jgi:hypothetical protein